MKSIYGCKLYRASKRKSKIRAAIENPINSELVTQLAEYLDEEYQTPQHLDKHFELSQDDDSDEASTSSGRTRTTHHASSGGGFSSPKGFSEGDIDSIDDIDEESDGEDIKLDEESEETSDKDIVEDKDDMVEESTSCKGSTVLGSSECRMTLDIVDEIKGILNMRNDTCDVNRVLVKENELWIHYDDKVNLNNVMGPVIELMNASGYTYLEFNRLARSENAIVFQISESDTSAVVNPVEGDQNE